MHLKAEHVSYVFPIPIWDLFSNFKVIRWEELLKSNFLFKNPDCVHSFTLQNSIAQLPVEELDRIQEYLQNSGLAQR